jgi:hypothetical protein
VVAERGDLAAVTVAGGVDDLVRSYGGSRAKTLEPLGDDVVPSSSPLQRARTSRLGEGDF